MRNILRAIFGLLGLPGDLDTLFTMLGISGGASAVTAYIAQKVGENAHWTIVAATAVFAFMMMGIYYIVMARKLLSVFERLTIDAIIIVQAIAIKVSENEMLIRGLTLECHLKNHSERTIYLKLKRESHSMSLQTPEVRKPTEQISIIPPGSIQKVMLSTLPDIKLGDALKGHIDLELLYGPAKDSLRYLLKYQAEPQIGYIIDPEKGGQLSLTSPITEHSHERLGWFK